MKRKFLRTPVTLVFVLAFAASEAAPLSPSECNGVQKVELDAVDTVTLKGLANGTLAPGCQEIFYIAGDACNSGRYFTMELWDLEQTDDLAAATWGAPRAQPILVAARGTAPRGFFNTTSNLWSFSPVGSLSDTAGQILLRPYLKVQATFGMLMGPQAATGQSECTDSRPCWYATVLNSHTLMSHPLQYQFRATCSASPSCPAPVWIGSSAESMPCSGNGRCQVALVPPPQDVSCVCDSGWSDVGCSVPIAQLNDSQMVGNSGLEAGQWEFYQITLQQDETTLLVELTRTRGDPILFVKGIQEGYEAGALPSTLDYSSFADRQSWRERSDTANIIRTDVAPGVYYVGVFNNNDNIQETANYTLRAQWSSGQTALCPWDCYGNGRCAISGLCICSSGYGGQYCAGTLTPIAFSQSMSGVVKPGEWSYFSLDLTSPTSRQQPLTINFNNDAGQGILLASFNNFPSLLSANFTFRAGQVTGAISQIVQPANLAPGILYIGIYNMDYYAHAPFNFHLQVSQTRSSSPSYTPWISIGVALACSGFVGFVIFQCHRAYLRRRAGARGWEMWSWTSLRVVAPVPRRRRAERRRGLDPALVQSFPMYTHDASKLARGESQTPKTDIPSEDEKLCSVCLCDYEDGDLIRQLLPCRHDFHSKCIDQWLMKNNTCPMCRVSLVTKGYGRPQDGEAVEGGQIGSLPLEDEGEVPPSQEGDSPSPAGGREERQVFSGDGTRDDTALGEREGSCLHRGNAQQPFVNVQLVQMERGNSYDSSAANSIQPSGPESSAAVGKESR